MNVKCYAAISTVVICLSMFAGYASGGQTVTLSGTAQTAVVTTPRVLTCEKYQHVQQAHSECSRGDFGTPIFCDTWVPERCVDDIHFVTEREWQELMERIKNLESSAKR